jgi:primosomal protein N' (replication factor Y)
MTETLIDIAIPGTPRRLFTYRLKNADSVHLIPGQHCLVPLGRRKVIGFYIAPAKERPEINIKAVIDIPSSGSLFNPELFQFLNWMADYYITNIADVLTAALPPEVRKLKKPSYIAGPGWEQALTELDLPKPLQTTLAKKGLLTSRIAANLAQKFPGLLEQLLDRTALLASYDNTAASSSDNAAIPEDDIFGFIKLRPGVADLVPNQEQSDTIKAILSGLDRFTPSLIHGITGSGKTLVYCHIAREILAQGKTVMVMVPEIALAGTLLSYFRSFFGPQVALIHSAMRPRDRLLIWQNIQNGRYKIVIGPRSAIFAPLDKLGLIIVDEEHDESYKQDDPAPRFQGRDSAVMRAKMADIPIILGSASPSLESYYNAQSGRYRLLKLMHRPENVGLPVVRLVDLKEERVDADHIFFTSTLVSKVNEALHDKHQVILYLNRRGFSPRIKCTDCGHTPLCPHCQLHLTYHRAGDKLMCHFCGFIKADHKTCEKCGGSNFLYIGTGTQKIEEKISELFPDARMVRLDSDSAAERNRAHLILSDFAAGKYNLLLGTQMVTKGIDFPRVALVGVLMADIGMDMPDFRADEKLFAKLVQVAGRSGRGTTPGEVIIQTFNPETDLIDDAARQDYETFYDRELASRRDLSYPPFAHLVNFRFSAKKETALQDDTMKFRARLAEGIKKVGLTADILGPAPCPLYNLRGLYRRHLFVKTVAVTRFVKFLSEWDKNEPNLGLPSRLKLTIDIDPYDMM